MGTKNGAREGRRNERKIKGRRQKDDERRGKEESETNGETRKVKRGPGFYVGGRLGKRGENGSETSRAFGVQLGRHGSRADEKTAVQGSQMISDERDGVPSIRDGVGTR
jgi:hypothetical protein